MPGRSSLQQQDPFAAALAPPPNETPAERIIREDSEREAKQRSDSIDELLKQERNDLKKKKVVKLLLLGQSESGKSTTLRQFQLTYTPQAFRAERAAWRGVIQLNVVRSVRVILDALAEEQEHETQRVSQQQEHEQGQDGSSHALDDASSIDHIAWTDEHERLRMRLSPLRHVEAQLMARIRAPAEDDDKFARQIQSSFNISTALPLSDSSNTITVAPINGGELSVRADWKKPFSRLRLPRPRTSLDSHLDPSDNVDEPTEIIAQCREDMVALWDDPCVRELLKRRKLRIEELSGFFLNDLQRVAARNYYPSSDDVLRARLKTVGVSEYRFEMEIPEARTHGSEWRIIDVGGTRSQRDAWAPFFDDSNAIIFLAPISAFDQVLAEDRSVNRLEDSVGLWKQICSNKLLAGIELILFLNKMDILDTKLKSGVRLAKYVRNFADRANDLETAAKYFRSKFHAIHREYSTRPRKFYCFTTSVTDVVTTSGILAAVRDIIIRQYLKESRLM